MAAAPNPGPKVRVRAARADAHDSGLLAGLKKLLHPLW
jgi:hypothetical protein